MSNSSILGGQRAARQAPGKDVDALGPSDSSDSGSDVQGEHAMATRADQPDELGALPVDVASDSDASGTGERGSATGRDGPSAADIMPTSIQRLDGDPDALDGADSLEDLLDIPASDVEGLSLDDDAEEDVEGIAEDAVEDRPRRENRGSREV